MRTILRRFLGIILVLGAAPLAGCSFPNAAAPGPSAIAVDGTANQVWVVASGKVYRCSVSGSALNCAEATTNLPK